MNVQVMFLSGHGSRDNVAKSYESGASLFLAKPIDPERLLRNVDVYFEKSSPPVRQKKLSLRQIEIVEKTGQKLHSPATPMPKADRDKTPLPIPIPVPLPRSEQPPAAHNVETSASPSTVRLPVYDTSTASQVPRVLIAEDDKDLAALAHMCLSQSFEVVLAQDGLDAVEKVVKYQPDIIIVDVMMPKMNGYQLCQSVRSNLSFTHTPIIFITAKATPKDRDYARRLGADAFLAKPFDIEELHEVCKGFAKKQGFRVRPKKMSAFEIHAEELQEKQPRKGVESKFDRLR